MPMPRPCGNRAADVDGCVHARGPFRLPPRGRRAALDVQRRRRHRLVQQRAPVHDGGRDCRRSTPCASRSGSTTSSTRTRRRRAATPSASARRSPRAPGMRSTSCCASACVAATVPTAGAPARNLVFLVDVSGSMQSPDRLPLVRTSLRMLVDQLTARDRIALVVYAGRTELVLPSTPGDQRERIHAAIERLEAGGSTNGAGGIQLAYQAAREGFIARRRQPRRAGDRRRLQRRRHQPGRADAPHRDTSGRAASSCRCWASAAAT